MLGASKTSKASKASETAEEVQEEKPVQLDWTNPPFNNLFPYVIANYLTPTEIGRMSKVAKFFHRVFDQNVWKKKTLQQYGRLISSLVDRDDFNDAQKIITLVSQEEWREVYRLICTSEIFPTQAQMTEIKTLLIVKQKVEEKEIQEQQTITRLSEILSEVTSLNLYSVIGKEMARRIAEVIKSNQTLTSLILYGNQVGDHGAAQIAEALKSNYVLASFSLGVNRVGENGAIKIAKALKFNHTLVKLDFGDNQFGDNGAGAFAEFLKINSTLTSLNLGFNQIGDIGATQIAEALKINQTLTSLNLWGNQIDDVGATQIAEALKVNRALVSLNLEKNQIGDKGAKQLIEAFKIGGSIIKFSLWSNPIGDQNQREINHLIQQKRQLRIRPQ